MDAPPEKAARNRFRRRRIGVWDLTYEDPSSSFRSRVHSLLADFETIRKRIPYVIRFFADATKVAPVECFAYGVTAVWQGIYYGINLYWMSILFGWFKDGLKITGPSPDAYRTFALHWIFCAMIDVVATRVRARSFDLLGHRLRAHLTPQLIRASLRVDLLSIQESLETFPRRGPFGSDFPGDHFLQALSHLVLCVLGLVSQLFVLVYVLSRKRSPEREVLWCFCIARGLLWCLCPSNGIGASSYVYWPHNRHFMRMKALFGLAFSREYRTDLMLDGIANSIETEYEESAALLGDVELSEPSLPTSTAYWRHWGWDFLLPFTSDLQMAIYVLMHPLAYPSSSSVSSMALLQQANFSITLNMGRYTFEASSLLDICWHAKRLYDAIDYRNTMPQGTEPYPRLIDSRYDAGMKISFRRVSLRYPGSDHDALHDLSFDILPGELVLVVGTNGCGKSSMLKLLARLFDPTTGDILIDDVPLVRYDMDQLRPAMTFQSQSPVIYPVNVRENITFALPPRFGVGHAQVEEAARMGGCSEWIARLGQGYDTQLEPSFEINGGWCEGLYGGPSKALQDELGRHNGHKVSISGGEKQRLASARTFMRVTNRATRLVVVDEATSALDPVAERNIQTEFRKIRAGKTIVLVTHRFHHLAHEADRILCMKHGRVIESGTHAELVRLHGDYAALYHAQVDSTA